MELEKLLKLREELAYKLIESKGKKYSKLITRVLSIDKKINQLTKNEGVSNG